MTEHITERMLDKLCERLNKMTGSPLSPYRTDQAGKVRANVGNYHISHAYGGVCLHRMYNESGGVTTPLGAGHGPKRDLWNRMQAYVSGIEDTQAAARAVNPASEGTHA